MFTGKNVMKSQKTKFKKNSDYDIDEHEYSKEKKKQAKQIYRNLREEEEDDWYFAKYTKQD